MTKRDMSWGQTNAEDCPGQERIEETRHTG